jgi:hypothetical protein
MNIHHLSVWSVALPLQFTTVAALKHDGASAWIAKSTFLAVYFVLPTDTFTHLLLTVLCPPAIKELLNCFTRHHKMLTHSLEW